MQTKTFPEVPSGWQVLRFLQSYRNPRDCIVLCRASDANGEEYVTWYCNMIEGGCVHGKYTSDFDVAWQSFQERIGRMS